jgi:hypothetical protein
MTKEQKILAAMRAHSDPAIRAAAEKVAKVPGWKAQDMVVVLREMLAAVQS